jgi:AAA15 family ATPase/GTPase
MKIDQLTVQNYKAFKEEAVFSIKPLTLVFGENNAGKSSLVRLIPSVEIRL